MCIRDSPIGARKNWKTVSTTPYWGSVPRRIHILLGCIPPLERLTQCALNWTEGTNHPPCTHDTDSLNPFPIHEPYTRHYPSIWCTSVYLSRNQIKMPSCRTRENNGKPIVDFTVFIALLPLPSSTTAILIREHKNKMSKLAAMNKLADTQNRNSHWCFFQKNRSSL